MNQEFSAAVAGGSGKFAWSEGFDMRTRHTGAAAILLVAASGSCNAQVVVKQEPLDMRNGATVLVDDGSCGKGKVKRVTVTHGNAMPGAPLRDVKCVPR